MADTIKDKAARAGQEISEAATKAGHTVSEKVEEAADWATEKAHQAGHKFEEIKQKVEHQTGMNLSDSHGATRTTADIREHMEVYASCGTLVGKVDHVEGSFIKLTKNDSPDGLHHLIPLAWVDKVDNHVHLDRDHVEVMNEWQPA